MKLWLLYVSECAANQNEITSPFTTHSLYRIHAFSEKHMCVIASLFKHQGPTALAFRIVKKVFV